MTLHDDLVAAKALIDTLEKWTKAAVDNGPGTPCCTVRALNRVSPWRSERNDAAREALRQQIPATYRGFRSKQYGVALGNYNDDPTTTHADIMALFDRAINAALSPTEGERG